VLSLLATVPGISDSEEVAAKLKTWDKPDHPADLAPDGHPAGITTLEFRHVDFAYTDGEPVLKDFNLTVQAGQTIALVGASGGGKSTIVNLAARFYEPTGGSILVNGHDLRDRSLAWYQSNLGIVLQGPHLFSGSVRENIRYGRLDATDEEIEQAARSVNADGFTRALEDGYDTDVGEGGNRLSTGQKQLVSFARALLANPRIFIMDEATSSIDTETEQLIQQGLKAIFQGRISFVIAHRLSTIRTADRILVIEKGHILESGTHQELLAKKGHYHALYTHQFQQEREASLFGKLG
jgi:ATP-binding cassette subfamily B protein